MATQPQVTAGGPRQLLLVAALVAVLLLIVGLLVVRPMLGGTEAGQTATCSGSQNRLGYPISGDVTDYGCRDGDVFVSGTLGGG
jgi:hypothetical protein